MIEIDGSKGEGGGQILRTALSLSVVTGKPFAIRNIRARRAKPGLMRQHLTAVKAAAEISGARVEGAEVGATALAFRPGPVKAGDYVFRIGSAGSTGLVLQTVLLPLALAGGTSSVIIEGGTHNMQAPPYEFLDRAFLPLVRRAGFDVSAELRRPGFYPAGGGEVEADIVPPGDDGLRPFDLLSRGEARERHAECLAPGIARHVMTRELETLGTAMGWSGEQLRFGSVRQDEGPGNALIATLAHAEVTEVFTAFGEKSLSAEQVAHGLVGDLRAFLRSDAAVGPHLADQLALLLALGTWQSGRGAAFTCSELTQHTRTNCAVIERFLPVRFAITESRQASTVQVSPA